MNLAAAALGLCLVIPAVHAQTFEVASVRPSQPHGGSPMSLLIEPGGRVIASGTPLQQLILKAYSLRAFQLSRGPDLLYSQFDINAKPAAAIADDQVLPMLRSLLADRFKLKVHRETREAQVYVLTIDKNGSKLTAAQPVYNAGVRIGGIGRLTGISAAPEQLAETLSDIRLNGRAFLDRPVLDRTGLKGVYNFSLTWTPDAIADPSEPSIFTAVREQLGLKLESTRAQVEYLVIDHLERPTEN